MIFLVVVCPYVIAITRCCDQCFCFVLFRFFVFYQILRSLRNWTLKIIQNLRIPLVYVNFKTYGRELIFILHIFTDQFFVNWNTMTRKPGEHLRTKFGNNGQLFDLFGLISNIYHWRSNQRPQIAELKLYNWTTDPYRTQVTPNLVAITVYTADETQ